MTDKRTKALAKTMRRRMTKYEYRLYTLFLSTLPLRVCRQKVIDDYIVDFLIPESKLIIEVDGAYHAEREQQKNDAIRTANLEHLGFRVIRFTNEEVLYNTGHVIHVINQQLFHTE